VEEFLIQHWPLLIPIVLINYVLVIAALVDLFRRERVLGNRKWVWAVLILFIQYIGPIVYFVLGRKE
jgi:hypothetical protein